MDLETDDAPEPCEPYAGWDDEDFLDLASDMAEQEQRDEAA